MADPETVPIPALARTAFRLASEDAQRLNNQIAEEALAAMGLSSTDGWKVDVPAGVAFRMKADTV